MHRLLAFLEDLGHGIHFALRATLALPAVFTRAGSYLTQLSGVLLGALPLALAAGVGIGLVLWMHLGEAVTASRVPGAREHLPMIHALAIVLEFAPLAAGLIVAGRSGASLGAELGSMRQTEQVDALEVLGFSPLRELVAPRLAACMTALPLLTLFIAYLALLAGAAAEQLGGSLTWTLYWARARDGLYLDNVIPATLKTVGFGYLIGVVGCYEGLRAQGGTEGVGRAATGGVVGSIFLVLLADVLLVKVIQTVTAMAGGT